MKDEDIQNLLGGFATDTLTDRERELLFTAALQNQELFNALADEQALREFLSDPASRRRLLQALQPREPGVFERLTSWMRRPAAWALAGSVMAALVVAVAVRQSRPPALDTRTAAPVEAPPSPRLAAPPPAAPEVAEPRRARAEKKEALRDDARSEREYMARANAPATAPPAPKNEMAAAPPPPPKLRLAVLDFDSSRAKEADSASADVGKAASDLLGKKLDSSGYTIIDRKQVDEALQSQNLNQRQLDPSTAARFGRSLGADAVILGSVTQAAQKTKGALGGFRAAAPATQSKVAEQVEVRVTAQAINVQTAGNLGVAVAQGEQTPGGGLANAVDQVASSLGQQIQQNARLKLDGLVTDVTANTLTLSVGVKAGVKVGDRFEVRRAGRPIGRVSVSAVKDSSSVGAFEGSGPAKIGDSVATPQQ